MQYAGIEPVKAQSFVELMARSDEMEQAAADEDDEDAPLAGGSGGKEEKKGRVKVRLLIIACFHCLLRAASILFVCVAVSRWSWATTRRRPASARRRRTPWRRRRSVSEQRP